MFEISMAEILKIIMIKMSSGHLNFDHWNLFGACLPPPGNWVIGI
jgi:hypothetical protein